MRLSCWSCDRFKTPCFLEQDDESFVEEDMPVICPFGVKDTYADFTVVIPETTQEERKQFIDSFDDEEFSI